MAHELPCYHPIGIHAVTMTKRVKRGFTVKRRETPTGMRNPTKISPNRSWGKQEKAYLVRNPKEMTLNAPRRKENGRFENPRPFQQRRTKQRWNDGVESDLGLLLCGWK
ncbi:unnamed protein product [Prunus armeniaca]